MIKNLLFFVCIFSFMSTSWAQGKKQMVADTPEYIRCYTDQIESARRANDPNVPSIQEFEEWMKKKIEERKNAGETERATYTIPYIVHVIHDGDPVGIGDNISATQINAQIQQINDDFQRMNSDAGNTPAAFMGVAGSIDIEFKPALIDENNNLLAEPGIQRINRNTMGWTAPPYGACVGQSFDPSYIQSTIKPNSIWDPNRYFNFWLMDLTCNILGYAQFPTSSGLPGVPGGGTSATDGVVFLGSSVGSIANPGNGAPFNLGRTATHEVGHWLGLRHIWGDANCGNDFCDDTPTQSGPNNSNCPNFPSASCGNGPNGDMFMNYMDYTTDACMNLFTEDQVDRFEAVLANSPRRKELLTSTVWENPSNIVVAQFSSDVDMGCGPLSVSFTDESIAGSAVDPLSSWFWNFDVNGLGGVSPSNFSGQNPPSVTFSNNGTYTVELTVNNGTESNSKTLEIDVFDIQQVDNFNNGSPTIFLSGDGGWGFIGGHNNYGDVAKAEFFNNLENGAMLESADFFFFKAVGNSNSPVKFCVYNNTPGNTPGSIISTKTITIGDLNENDWTTVDFPDIEISGPVYIGFELEYIAGDTLAVFTNQDGETTPATAWEQFPSDDWHRFDESPGSWGVSVALRISANVACPVANEPPVAEFESDDQMVCSGVEVNFTDLSTNDPTSWSWNFGDGVGTSTEQNPTYTYATGGNYTVTLVATNAEGSDTETKMNYISVQTEPANFQGNASATEICVGENVNLSMSGTFGASYSWEENGNITNGASISVSPTTTTTYTAICDNGVCRVTDEVTITVNPLPTVTISANGTVLSAVSATATAWQWSDGSGEISQATGMTYTATASGTYTVEVTDANGCINTSAGFSILLEPPVADFSADVTTVCEGDDLTFTDASTNNPTSWAWSFGDGNTSSMQNPTHSYAAGGPYTVTLTATNAFGSDSETKMNYISVQTAPTGFAANADVTEVCPGEAVSLSMTGTFSAAYSWEVNGNNIANGSSTTVNPSQTTIYTALCDDGVCSAEDNITISTFAVSAGPTIAEDGFDLTADGTAPFQWYMNGNAIPNETSATYTVTENGTYTVTGTDENGCVTALSSELTISNTAVIDETLDAAITIFPNPVSDVLSIRFSNNNLGNLTLSLMDVTGRLIQSEKVTKSDMQMNMRSLASGVYIVKITNEEGGIAVREIVKK